MSAEKKRQKGVLGLIIALVAILTFSVVFVGAVGGWFSDPKVKLSEEYYGDYSMTDLTGEEYERLVEEGKSFVVFVDQGGCTTADRLRGFVEKWATDAGVRVYRMMFADMKEASLHDSVKYYPSFVVVSKGKPHAWLRADADEDADAYNDYDAFVRWVGERL